MSHYIWSFPPLLPLFCYPLISYLPFNFLSKPLEAPTGQSHRQLLPPMKGPCSFSLYSSVFATSVFFFVPLLVSQRTGAQGQQSHSWPFSRSALPESSKPVPQAQGNKHTTAACWPWAPSEKLLGENLRSSTTRSPLSQAAWSAHEPGPRAFIVCKWNWAPRRSHGKRHGPRCVSKFQEWPHKPPNRKKISNLPRKLISLQVDLPSAKLESRRQ